MIKQLFNKQYTRLDWHRKFLFCRVISVDGKYYLVVWGYVWRKLVEVEVDCGLAIGVERYWQYSLTEVKTCWQEP